MTGIPKADPEDLKKLEEASREPGRPTVMTTDTVNKLEAAFTNGLNVSEACLYANISRQTYYAYCKETEGFSDRVELLRTNVSMIAKQKVVEAIRKGDVDVAEWYLERVNKEEFSTRQEKTGAGGKDLPADQTVVISDEDAARAYVEAMNRVKPQSE